MIELCEINIKLAETGMGELILHIYGEMLDSDTYVINELAKAQIETSFISEVNEKLINRRHEILSMLLEKAGIDIPACTSEEDRRCITIGVYVGKAKRYIAIFYVDDEGNHVKIYP
jgi:hypothetical protein